MLQSLFYKKKKTWVLRPYSVLNIKKRALFMVHVLCFGYWFPRLKGASDFVRKTGPISEGGYWVFLPVVHLKILDDDEDRV